MLVHVAVATTGRADILRQNIKRLDRQSRRADGILIVGATRDDFAGVEPSSTKLETMLAPRGLCAQRNAALDRLRGTSDVVVFFDDDFVPAHDFLEKLERLMSENPSVVGATGVLVADGAGTGSIAFDEAVTRLDIREERPKTSCRPCHSLYGCNMAIRLSAAGGLRFDEALPLYGWQEDVDFTHQLSWRGVLLKSSELTGIHLGTLGGRTSGRRLGYSQVANIVYLRRKGTLAPWHGETQLFRNIVSNVLHAIWPNPAIDHRGRLVGNLLAIGDLLRIRIDPRRIEYL